MISINPLKLNFSFGTFLWDTPYKHSCRKFINQDGQMALIVTGGRTATDSKPKTSTEMFINGAWSTIPAYLPIGVYGAKCVTLNNQLFLFGGYDGYKKLSQILKLTTAGRTYRLDPRDIHAVGVIPDINRISFPVLSSESELEHYWNIGCVKISCEFNT